MISFIFCIFLIIQSVKGNDFLFGDSLPFVIPFWIILGIAFLILWILIVLSWIKYFRFVNKAKKNKTGNFNNKISIINFKII